MSELKAFNMPRCAGEFTMHEVYLKSEADKVIAEKDEEIYNINYSRDEWAKACNQKDKEIAELNDKLRHYPMMVALLESDKREIAELKEERRWRKFPEEKPPKYTWCLISGKNQMGNYIVIMDFFEEDDWAENPNLDDDTLDIEWWLPLPSAPEVK